MKSVFKFLAAFLAILVIVLAILPNAYAENEKVVIVFDEGHGQYYDSGRLSMFLDDLKSFYEVRINKDKFTNSDLEDATILIIPNPSRGDFSSDEVELVKKFVENGGVLIVMGDWYKYINVESLNKLVVDAGIEFTKTEVIDPYDFDYREYFPLVDKWADNEIAAAISKKVKNKIKYNGCMLKLSDPAIPVLLSSEYSFTVNEKEEKIAKGSVPVTAVVFKGNGIIIAIGGSRVASTRYFYESKSLGNRSFMLSLIEWALEKKGIAKLYIEASIAVSPAIVPVGEEKKVKITVTIENKGAEISDLSIKIESEFYSGEKSIEVLPEQATETIVFEFDVMSNELGKKPVKVTISKDALSTTILGHIVFAKEKSVIILDMAHGEYFGPDALGEFIKLLENYGVVVVNNDKITENTLSYAKLLILLNPEESLDYSEIDAIKSWIRDGGNLIISGSWYKYFNPMIFNGLTRDFGIEWLDGSVRDESSSLPEKPYAAILSNWASNDEAKELSKNVESVVYSGTSLKVTGEAKPILTGGSQTVVVDENDNTLASGSDVVCMAVVTVNDKGKIFATGSTIMFLNTYYDYDIFNHNRRFFMNLLDWIITEMAEEVKLPSISVDVTVPESLKVGESGELVIKVKNIGKGVAEKVIIVLSTNQYVKLNKQSIELGNINPNEEKQVTVIIEGIEDGKGQIEVKVSAENHSPITKLGFVQVSAPPQPLNIGLIVAVVVLIGVIGFIVYKKFVKKT